MGDMGRGEVAGRIQSTLISVGVSDRMSFGIARSVWSTGST